MNLELERERTRRWIMSVLALIPLLSLVALLIGKLTVADVKDLVASFGLTQPLCLAVVEQREPSDRRPAARPSAPH